MNTIPQIETKNGKPGLTTFEPGEMNTYTSVVDAITDLKHRGYKDYFRREPTFIYCSELDIWFDPDEFDVDEFYQFGQNLNPDADRVLYAITSSTGIKGTVLDAYGVYTEKMSFKMALKLQRS